MIKRDDNLKKSPYYYSPNSYILTRVLGQSNFISFRYHRSSESVGPELFDSTPDGSVRQPSAERGLKAIAPLKSVIIRRGVQDQRE